MLALVVVVFSSFSFSPERGSAIAEEAILIDTDHGARVICIDAEPAMARIPP